MRERERDSGEADEEGECTYDKKVSKHSELKLIRG